MRTNLAVGAGVAAGSRAFVFDQNTTANVSCTLSAKGPNGFLFAFSTQAITGSSAAVKILTFGALASFADGHDGETSDCTEARFDYHQGTNIAITQAQADEGMAVRAAADGEVLWVFDGKYDRCPNAEEPDCAAPHTPKAPNDRTGYRVCTPSGRFCGTGTGDCYWCFYGGNLIVIRHRDTPGVFATRYDKLKRGSITVQPGDRVERGQKIAEAAAAGFTTFPGLNFEVWSTGFYEHADPWDLECSPSGPGSLWENDPPWSSE